MIYAFGYTGADFKETIKFIDSQEEGIFIIPENLVYRDHVPILTELTKNEKKSIIAGIDFMKSVKGIVFAYGEENFVYMASQVFNVPCGSKQVLTQVSVCSHLFEWGVQDVKIIAHSSSLSLEALVGLQQINGHSPVLEQLSNSKAILATASYKNPSVVHPFTLRVINSGTKHSETLLDYVTYPI
jgi:hypothetical protein